MTPSDPLAPFLGAIRDTVSEAVAAALEQYGPANDGPPEVLTRKQAAAYLQVSVATLDRLAAKGEIVTRYVGDSPRYLRGELRQWLTKPQPEAK